MQEMKQIMIAKRLTIYQAVKKHCREHCDPENCPIPNCSLKPFKDGHNPYIKKKPKQARDIKTGHFLKNTKLKETIIEGKYKLVRIDENEKT